MTQTKTMNPAQAKIVEKVVEQISKKDLSKQAVFILKQAASNVLARVQQNIDAQVQEESSPIIEDFVKSAAGKMINATQAWADGVKNEMVVFPEGTRYIFRDGSITTIIVEETPRVRTIDYENRKLNLSLPYVQFVIAFQNGKPLQQLWVTANKKAISDLDHPIGFLPLTNMNNDHSVCLGSTPWPQKGNMSEMVAKIIAAYWGSQFSHSLNTWHLQFLKNNNLSIDEWEKKSVKDPLFILKCDFAIGAGDKKTLRSLIIHDNQTKNGTISVVNNLKAEIITAVGEVGGEINSILKALDLDVENREKVHVESLEGVLKEIIIQAYTELWDYLQRQLNEERTKMRTEIEAAANKLKQDFARHMENYNNSVVSKSGTKKAY